MRILPETLVTGKSTLLLTSVRPLSERLNNQCCIYLQNLKTVQICDFTDMKFLGSQLLEFRSTPPDVMREKYFFFVPSLKVTQLFLVWKNGEREEEGSSRSYDLQKQMTAAWAPHGEQAVSWRSSTAPRCSAPFSSTFHCSQPHMFYLNLIRKLLEDGMEWPVDCCKEDSNMEYEILVLSLWCLEWLKDSLGSRWIMGLS